MGRGFNGVHRKESNVRSIIKLHTGKNHIIQANGCYWEKRKNSLPYGMTRLIYTTSTFSTTLKFVNSRGVHGFFLHFHLLSFVLQKSKKVTGKW